MDRDWMSFSAIKRMGFYARTSNRIIPMVLLVCCCALTGCESMAFWKKKDHSHETIKQESDSNNIVIQANFEDQKNFDPLESKELKAAEEVYEAGDYKRAEKLFHEIGKNKKNPPQLAERAIFLEGECLRLQNKLVKAAATFYRLTEFSTNTYRLEASVRMFEIANYWLQDSYRQIEEEQQVRQGKRWFSSSNLIHWDLSKPVLDEEGNALERMEQVYLLAPEGPLADRSLYTCGYIYFHRRHYTDADACLKLLYNHFPNSPYRARAVELLTMAKNNSTGGPSYDGRRSADALKLIQTASNTMPELKSRQAFLDRQIILIRAQQADKDLEIADFYRRRGMAPSAYFSYEIVRRRYPGTKQADVATQKMAELHRELERSKQGGPFFRMKAVWHKYVLGIPLPSVPDGAELPQSPLEVLEQKGSNGAPNVNPPSNNVLPTPNSLPNNMLQQPGP